MSDDTNVLGELERMETRAPLETRSAEVLDIRHPDRIIELIAVPWEAEAPLYRNGSWVTETVTRGAFDGVEHRARRVKVNRDHQLDRTCGVAVALDPRDDRGLIAKLRISNTPLGNETLELASDGVLDASVAFAPMRGGEEWSEHRSRRRINRAWLGHIALVPDPAYEGAEVLDVRSATLAALRDLGDGSPRALVNMVGNMTQDLALTSSGSITPRKDEVLAMLAELGYPRTPK